MLTPRDVLFALTAVRHQTSEERTTGAPAEHSLRSTRVALHGVGAGTSTFENLKLLAPLHWLRPPRPAELTCLAMATLATRHAGIGRTRGRGHVRLTLNGNLEYTQKLVTESKLVQEIQ